MTHTTTQPAPTPTTPTPTSTPASAPASGGPGVSGVDLARVALHAARAAADKRGATRDRAPVRRRAPVRPDGRDPNPFAAVLQGLMADRAWDMPAAGGSVLDQWPTIAATIAPGLDTHVTATAYHPPSGQLDLRPDSSAYATQLRLITPRIITAANEMVGTTVVRAVRVLPTGAPPTPTPASTPSRDRSAPPAAAAAAGPVKTRQTASPGYRQALAAHQAAVADLPDRRTDLAVARAAEAQVRALREQACRAFPEPDVVADDVPASIEQARAQRRRQAAATEAAALRRARAERAGLQVLAPQRFGKTA